MSITYWLNSENVERCFPIRRRGTVFEKEPAYITAYEVCKGLNEYYNNGKKNIPLRDAQTGKHFHDLPLTATVDKMIRWLREKHDIFYSPAMNLCIPLEDPLSRSVKNFWDEEDAQQKKIEEYCKNDPACGLSLKKLHNQYGEIQRLKKERDELKEERDNLVKRLEGIDKYYYAGHVCSGCKRTTCGYFAEILSSLGIKDAYITSGQRGSMSIVEAYAKAANKRAQVIFKENQTLMQQVDAFSKIAAEDKDKIESLKMRTINQEEIIKSQNRSLERQARQLKDLGVALGNVKNTVDFEIDTLMSDHGDEIIPEF